MWILVVFGILLIYGIYMEHKDSKNGTSKTTRNSAASESASDSYGYTYGSTRARSLCYTYEQASAAHNTATLSKTVEEILGDHWSCIYAEDYESACLYEEIAQKRPYTYPINGQRRDYRGLTLYQILINQNVEIRARKEGKAPYSTPLPYKPKQ